jgi:hypothetical protein
MKRVLLLLVLVTFAVTGASASSANAATVGNLAFEVAPLEPVGGSGVTGVVVIAGLPQGGSFVVVFARGLAPNTQYTSFYYDDRQCSVGPEEVATFQSNSAGIGFASAVIDDDPDEVGSVSVRTPDYSVLFACAHLSGGE